MKENGRTNFEQSSLKSRPLWVTLCIKLFITRNLCKNIFKDSPKITNIEKTIE